MRRPIFFVILSFLLLFMQQEAQVHALSHLGPQLARSHEAEVLVPQVDAPCIECTLLAAGTTTVHGDGHEFVSVAPVTAPCGATFRSRVADAPAFFRSRAPPFLA